MDAKTLMRAWGTQEPDKIVASKFDKAKDGGIVCRAAKPKVTRVRLKPDECAALCKGIGLEYLEGYEERVLQYCLTDETVDRYGDIVIAARVDFKNYMQQPVVLAFHNGHSFPIGNIIKIWHDEAKRAIMGWVLFFDERLERSPEQIAETAFRYASSGAMKAGSIGFNPGEVRRPSDEERKALRMPPYGVLYDKSDLMEFSVTPVPANPNATQRSFDVFSSAGIKDAEENAIIDAMDIDAMLRVIEDVQRGAPATEPVTEPATETIAGTVTHEHVVTVNLGIDNESIITLVNKMGILCDRLSIATRAMESLAQARSTEPATPSHPGCRTGEASESDALREIVAQAAATVAKLRK